MAGDVGQTETLDDSGATAVVAAAAAARLAPGTQLGRYRIVRVLGAGGMGEVYAAHDPELDREIAIKVVGGGAVGGEVRLVGEAQAMARLQHANVVRVHDVGVADGRVFVAMELIAGTTLGTWAQASRRRRRAVVGALVAAGRGLAAAHDAGIVHRDFKPDNVLVGDDGVVRVADFGLARPTVAPASDAAPVAPERTGAGAVVGTPAYMAPEQHVGAAVTAAADQYAFCVALWELALGTRPFAGATLAELAAAKRRGEGRAPPRGAPRWLVAALRRGLAPDPAARFPSMTALLAALERGLARRRRAWIVAIAGAMLAGGAALSWALGGGAPRPACGDDAAGWRDRWDAGRAAALRRAFVATGRPHGGAAADRAIAGLDGYVAAWRATRLATCRGHAGGGLDVAIATARNRCLDAARVAAGATVANLVASPLGTTVDDAETIVAGLPAIADCAAVVAATPQLQDPAVAAAIEESQVRVAGGDLVGAAAAAQRARARAEAAGDPIAIARARLALGVVLREQADPAAAVELSAAAAAAGERGAWAVVAEADLTLVEERAMHGDTDGLVAVIAAARAALARVAEPRLRVELQQSEVAALLALGRPGEAADACRTGLADGERLWGARSHRLAIGLAYCADVDFARDDNQAAFDKLSRALALLIAELGPDHPKVADVRHGLGIADRRLGRPIEARRQYEAALAVRERIHGAGSPYVADSLNSLAIVLDELGEAAAARATAARALASAEQAFGTDSRRAAAAHMLVARHDQAAGDRAAARRHAERGFAIFAAHAEEPDVELAYARIQWADILVADHQPAAAADSATAAITILERAGDPALMYAVATLGKAELDRGDASAAVPPLERALVLATPAEHAPAEVAAIELDLARALWRSGRDRARGLTLARTARRRLIEAGLDQDALATQAAAWLAHPR